MKGCAAGSVHDTIAPAELERVVIEPADGESALAVVLRREDFGVPELVDISDQGGWRNYRSRENDSR